MSQALGHADRGHARLSPSSSSLWSVCTAGPGLIASLGLTRRSSTESDEGTRAHEIAEEILLGKLDAPPAGFEALQHYINTCRAVIQDSVWHSIEVACPLPYDPDGVGTADFVAFGKDGVLRVVDLKFGKHEKVSVTGNTQLFIYAWAASELFAPMLPESFDVAFGVSQPRIDAETQWWQPDSAECSRMAAHLMKQATVAATGNGAEFVATKSACRWCPVRRENKLTHCPAHTDAIESLVPSGIEIDLGPTDEQKIRLWTDADKIRALLEENDTAVWAMANKPDSPVVKVNGRRGNRAWTKDAMPRLQELLGDKAFKPVVAERAMITVTEAETLLDKKVIESLVERSPGKPTLRLRKDLKSSDTLFLETSESGIDF